MVEYEAKLHVPGAPVEAVLEALSASGLKFDAGRRQVDRIFATSKTALSRGRRGSVVARIRYESGAAVMTVKRRIRGDEEREEAEFQVDDERSARRALELLGLRELVTVEKVRWEAHSPKGATIICDEVVGLGVFIEVEVLAPNGTGATLVDKNVALIRSALPVVARRVRRGYDRLLLDSSVASAAAPRSAR